VPGSVIAVGVLIPVTAARPCAGAADGSSCSANPGLLLTGGIAALVYAYLVRFLSVALQTVESSLGKITPSMDDAARSLGRASGRRCAGCICRCCAAACSPPGCWCSST
jgi:iron(III) transport system permease protein